ncbi:MAG: sulfate reduction electron transfer complex DsrMKJOP subunit DsrO [Planctomycetota bacterium]|jgi:molybdopterin-containing oxidoreductase family iron-sulfur binding subunit
MDDNRRDFMKKMGVATAAASLGLTVPLLRSIASQPGGHGPAKKTGKQLGMLVDFKKCLDAKVREACISACAKAHNLPLFPGHDRAARWIWTEPFEVAFHDQNHGHLPEAVREKPVLLLCNHCSKPACVKVCPTKATWKRDSDGVVLMDMHRCIGCRFCVVACPYRARSFNWAHPRDGHIKGELNPDYPTRLKGLVEKCTFCAERLRDDREPACVEATKLVRGGLGALIFGDVNDPKSEISENLREHSTASRLFGLGTFPNVYYRI